MSRIKEAMERVRGYLDKMGIKYIVDEEHNAIIAPYEIRGRDFLVVVLFSESWVLTAAKIVGLNELPPELDREKFFARLLMDTFYLNEITYGLTKDGLIVAHAESHVDALSFENFKVEFFSVVAGIAHFIDEIEKELPVKARGGPLYA